MTHFVILSRSPGTLAAERDEAEFERRCADAMRARLGVAEPVVEKVLANLSERARETLTDEIELLGPTPLREVEQAQTEVVALIRRLEEEGTITMSRGAEGGLVE